MRMVQLQPVEKEWQAGWASTCTCDHGSLSSLMDGLVVIDNNNSDDDEGDVPVDGPESPKHREKHREKQRETEIIPTLVSQPLPHRTRKTSQRRRPCQPQLIATSPVKT